MGHGETTSLQLSMDALNGERNEAELENQVSESEISSSDP